MFRQKRWRVRFMPSEPKLHRRIVRYLAKRYKTVNLFYNAWDERYEFDNEFSGDYKPRQFLWLMFKAWATKNVCWDCRGHGMTGYYEPEACSTCDGFGINWKNEQEPDWEDIVKGMQEYDMNHPEKEDPQESPLA